MVKKVWK